VSAGLAYFFLKDTSGGKNKPLLCFFCLHPITKRALPSIELQAARSPLMMGVRF